MKRKYFKEGFIDAIPVGLGYLAVSFSLGITAKSAGVNWIQAFIMSAINYASAGEYAGITVILSDGSYIEMVLMILVANCRYLLMSCALSQRFSGDTKFYHRPLMATHITDEIFALNIAKSNHVIPSYDYGAFAASGPAWAIGTSLGVIAGNILPNSVVNAFGVALYGMFIAIIIPPAKKNRVIAGIIIAGFIFSYYCQYIPFVSNLSAGTKIIILTVIISSIVAILFPVKEETEEEKSHEA